MGEGTKIIIMDNYQIIKCIAIVKQSDKGDYGFANFLYIKLFFNWYVRLIILWLGDKIGGIFKFKAGWPFVSPPELFLKRQRIVMATKTVGKCDV